MALRSGGPIAIGTSSVDVIPNSIGGDGMILHNSGSVQLWIGIGTNAVAGRGFPLAPGQTVGISDLSPALNQRISAIVASGSTTISFQTL